MLINPFISKISKKNNILNQNLYWQHTMLAMLLHADAFQQHNTMPGNKIIVLATIL